VNESSVIHIAGEFLELEIKYEVESKSSWDTASIGTGITIPDKSSQES
jgi:hypothetical protein